MDVIEQNKNTVTSFIDALFTKGDLGAVDEYLADDFTDHDPPMGQFLGREGMRQAAATFRAAFPDWHSDVGFHVAEGDLVVEHFTASGTHQGEIFGVPASGQTVSLPGINIWRVRDGRIVERWDAWTTRPDAPARPGAPALTGRKGPRGGRWAGRNRSPSALALARALSIVGIWRT